MHSRTTRTYNWYQYQATLWLVSSAANLHRSSDTHTHTPHPSTSQATLNRLLSLLTSTPTFQKINKSLPLTKMRISYKTEKPEPAWNISPSRLQYGRPCLTLIAYIIILSDFNSLPYLTVFVEYITPHSLLWAPQFAAIVSCSDTICLLRNNYSTNFSLDTSL